jgi:hypothetical protein
MIEHEFYKHELHECARLTRMKLLLHIVLNDEVIATQQAMPQRTVAGIKKIILHLQGS